MTLIDGDKIVTAQLYDDEHEEFSELKMSIIDYVNAYTNEGITTADDVLDKIRAEIWDLQYGPEEKSMTDEDRADAYNNAIRQVIEIIDEYRAESEE